MADDKHYVPGDFYRIDDLSGFKIRARGSRKQWDSMITDPRHYSPRQPQDLVVGVRDEQAVPDPRPRQTDQFVVLGTWVTAPSAAFAQVIEVASSREMQPGDVLLVMLDSGEQFRTVLAAINGRLLTLATKLPAPVGGGINGPLQGPTSLSVLPIENSVLDLRGGNPPVPPSNLFILNSPTNGILNQNILGPG